MLDSLTVEDKSHLKPVYSTSGVFHIEIERRQHPSTVQTKCACCLSTFTVPASTLSDGTMVLEDPAGVLAEQAHLQEMVWFITKKEQLRIALTGYGLTDYARLKTLSHREVRRPTQHAGAASRRHPGRSDRSDGA